jgi:hypothetical protein
MTGKEAEGAMIAVMTSIGNWTYKTMTMPTLKDLIRGLLVTWFVTLL